MTSDLNDPTPTRRPRPWLRLLILMAVAFAGGLAAMGYLVARSDRVAGWVRPAPAPMVIVRRVPAPAMTAPAAPAAREQAAALDQRLAAIERHVDQIDTRAQTAVGNADRAEGLLVAFAARRALDRGVQLGYIEALLRDRFGGTQPQAVAAVIGGARQPVTLDALRNDFEAAAPQLIVGEGDGDWWGALKRELSGLVVVRRMGTPSTAAVDRVARARAALSAGQVDVALAEVARMPARDAAAQWIASARRYVSARSALDAIETAALLTPEARRAAPMDETLPTTLASPDDATAETF
jgi:hypothetical protein